MVTKPKANSVVTQRLLDANGAPTTTFADVAAIAFDVRDGTQTLTETLVLANVSEPCNIRARIGGFVQRCANGAALSRDGKTFKSATPADKFAGIARIVQHLNSGAVEWTLKAERPDTSAQDAADTIVALTRAKRADGTPYAADVDAANAIVAAWAAKKGVDRDAAIKAWLTTKQVAAVVADIRAERARQAADAIEVDLDAMMAEMGE